MGLRIRTNVPALVAQRHLLSTKGHLDSAFERLSSGSRINKASDDAAGLANSETLRAQIRGLKQAGRNAQDGISVIQIAEGALGEISNILIRLRELAIQSASDTISNHERLFLQNECGLLLEEVDRIAQTTEFNRVPLLSGTRGAFDIQVGLRNHPTQDRIRLFDDLSPEVSKLGLGLQMVRLDTKLAAQLSIESIDEALEAVQLIRAKFGATQNRLQSTVQNIQISNENLSAAESRIRDTDMAETSSELAKHQILLQSGVAILSQANQTNQIALSLLNGGMH
jgi:flagellin